MIIQCLSCGSPNRVPADHLGRRARCGHCKETLATTGRPQAVADSGEFADIIARSPVPVLVDFWAPWCAPCHVVAPELEKIAEQRDPSLVVLKLNTEELPDVASRFAIHSIPTFILFRGGREAARASGAMHASQIERAVGL